MNLDPIGIHPIAYIASCLFWIAVIIGVWRWVTSLNRSHPALFNLAPTLPAPPIVNRADHPFVDLDATRLFEHVFNHHFEIWNHYGERNPAPATWRKLHATDHGARI